MTDQTTRWIPMDPQPPARTKLYGWAFGWAQCRAATAIFYDPENVCVPHFYEALHAPDDIIDDCRVVSVDVERHDDAWHWKITVEPLTGK